MSNTVQRAIRIITNTGGVHALDGANLMMCAAQIVGQITIVIINSRHQIIIRYADLASQVG